MIVWRGTVTLRYVCDGKAVPGMSSREVPARMVFGQEGLRFGVEHTVVMPPANCIADGIGVFMPGGEGAICIVPVEMRWGETVTAMAP